MPISLSRMLWIGSFLFALSAWAATPPRLEFDYTSEEYETLLQQRIRAFSEAPEANSLKRVIELGKRNLDWLNHINGRRPDGSKLSFSSAQTQNGSPVESPRENNESIVLGRMNEIQATIPPEMKEVLFEGKDFTDRPPIEVERYLEWGRKVDIAYQYATRWLLQAPYLSYYASKAYMDIRGYYFLAKIPDIESKLSAFSSLPDPEKQDLRGWLKGICVNGMQSASSCEREVLEAERTNRVTALYGRYLPGARELFDSFFRIRNERSDINWSANDPSRMTIPFITPELTAIRDFLTLNIEEEWRWQSWHLMLSFTDRWSPNTPHIEFEPGALPHVDAVGGSTITMDANAPLTEYDVQWTIRHEFGHVLGFPDCYIEFYDTARKVMVAYQIDLSNLMCSRKGHLKQTHFDELKRAYFR